MLPGVGAFGPCVDAIRAAGLDEVALERIEAGVPFFGICVGMQVLYAGSDESPGVDGLGVFAEQIREIPHDREAPPDAVEHVIERTVPDHPMFAELDDDAWVYFVHGYAAEPGPDVDRDVRLRRPPRGGGRTGQRLGVPSSTPRSRATTACRSCATSSTRAVRGVT